MDNKTRLQWTGGIAALAVSAVVLYSLSGEDPEPALTMPTAQTPAVPANATPTPTPATKSDGRDYDDLTDREKALYDAELQAAVERIEGESRRQAVLQMKPQFEMPIAFSRPKECDEVPVPPAEYPWEKCRNAVLVFDHPYDSYSIEQLEYAANHMNDADAAIILAERFAGERWRERRTDAHKYFLKAFILSNDHAVFDRMLGEMGLGGTVTRHNGILNTKQLAADYTMARVGQYFGVDYESRINDLLRVAAEADTVDFAALDRDAEEIYKTLLATREGL